MRKIIYVAPLRCSESGTPHAASAAIWLAGKGYDVTMVGPGQASTTHYNTHFGSVKTDLVQHTEGRSFLWFYIRLLFRLLKYRLTSNAIFYIHGSSVCASASLPLLCISPRRLVYHTQDFLQPGRHRLWTFFEKRIARRASYVVLNEPNRARLFAEHYKLKVKPLVVRTALPAVWPKPTPDQSLRSNLLSQLGLQSAPNIKIVAAGGGYSDVRCTKQLVQAVATLPTNYILFFTGVQTGTQSEYKLSRLLRETVMLERTVTLGFLPYDALLEHYAISDIGVLLYPDDGIGNYYQAPGRLTEYLVSGLPFVTSNFPGLKQLVEEYKIGLAVRPESVADIAGAIQELCELSDEHRDDQRRRLQHLASHELAYDEQAIELERIAADLCQ